MISQDNKIWKLRISTQKAYNTHSKLNIIDSNEKLTKAKQILQEEYNNIENNILESNIKQVEQSDEQCKHTLSMEINQQNDFSNKMLIQ